MIENFLVGRSNGNALEEIGKLPRDGSIAGGQANRMQCGAKRAQAGDDGRRNFASSNESQLHGLSPVYSVEANKLIVKGDSHAGTASLQSEAA